MTTNRASIDIGAEKDFLKEKQLKIGSLDAGDEEPRLDTVSCISSPWKNSVRIGSVYDERFLCRLCYG